MALENLTHELLQPDVQSEIVTVFFGSGRVAKVAEVGDVVWKL